MAVLPPLEKRILQSRESDADAEKNSSSASEEDALEYDMSEDSPAVISPPPPSKPEKANKNKNRCLGIDIDDDTEDEEVLNNSLPLFYQVGTGFDNTPGPSSRRPPLIEDRDYSENLENAMILDEIIRRRNVRYNANEIIFEARVNTDGLPDTPRKTPLKFAVQVVRQLIELLIRRCTQDLRPSDLIRFCVQDIGLDKPISTGIMTFSSLTVERMVSVIMRVLQSNDKITVQDGFTVDVITIRQDVGADKTNTRVVNIDIDRIRKKSVITVQLSEDGLCCAKAIIYAIADLEKNMKSINVLKDRRRENLLNRAKVLHTDAGVPLGPCTYFQIASFEDWLDVQIVVISSDISNQVSYRGRDRYRRINLWLHNGHYDIIKSLKGFYGTNNYCESCDKPFQNIKDHLCDNACHVCLRVNCMKAQSQRCGDCDRECRSAECFEAHKAISGQQQYSICDKIYQCRKCCKIILRRRCPKALHRCGTTQ
ncbi:hypothetical protein AVEN_243015-1 [Araneus ventricosus]|uniref:Uncharacterized protein n=1 Tax=Araneus ventricosus TaxID=182803 RepID=A0A4Y2D593_ARAVE|nr:hypothetical protein AVEN_243015-1 [Araneus ventricosus]